ncbi:MAG: hypothetical protein Q7J29_12885 [Stagnimonas sp.]|nr:hypothetical protein [Stagnimonas sp.]
MNQFFDWKGIARELRLLIENVSPLKLAMLLRLVAFLATLIFLAYIK